jgi:hypothetical protein
LAFWGAAALEAALVALSFVWEYRNVAFRLAQQQEPPSTMPATTQVCAAGNTPGSTNFFESTNWCTKCLHHNKSHVLILQTAMEDPMPRTASKTLPLDIQRM